MGIVMEDLLYDRYNRKPSVWSIVSNVLFTVVIVFLVILMILTQAYSICVVSGDSMEKTIYNGDMVACRPVNSLSRGDIVIATGGTEADSYNIIKRVVALPGDEIVFKSYGTPPIPYDDKHCKEVKLFIKTENGFVSEEELVGEDKWYLSEIMTEKGFKQEMFSGGVFTLYYGDMDEIYDHPEAIIKLGADEYFLLGDNRNDSRDSRRYGVFGVEKIQGRVASIFEQGTLVHGFLDFFFAIFSIKNIG